jgi:hypothetical protein
MAAVPEAVFDASVALLVIRSILPGSPVFRSDFGYSQITVQ